MHVCLDIQSALAQRAGVGRYTRMLAEHVAAARGNDALSLFYFDFKRRGCDFQPPGATARAVRWLPGRWVQAAWKFAGTPPFDWFAGHADVYHFPNFIRPPLSRGRSVVTIHDAAFLRFPETIEAKNYRYLSRRIRDTVDRADAVICVSAFTARELSALLQVPHERLRVIPSGLDARMRPPDEAALQSLRQRLGLDRPYLLAVGTLEPRKNYPFLMDVFDRLDFDGDLVIAGMRGWKTEGIFARREASPRRERIRLLEYVDDRDLPALYGAAALFVMPSLYEGFGFPPLEAMVCGVPVVAAATGSLPEVLGDAAHLVDGFDAEQWTSAITRMLADQDQRQLFTARGRSRAASYTWERTAALTWDVYRSLSA
ncbi:MAG TPA: glycosyltransferase family 1 protein [Kiritimatiellia bacterium]|nr:glycosyltransferase family 1 protein [Kiritimatiellia bacterium]